MLVGLYGLWYDPLLPPTDFVPSSLLSYWHPCIIIHLVLTMIKFELLIDKIQDSQHPTWIPTSHTELFPEIINKSYQIPDNKVKNHPRTSRTKIRMNIKNSSWTTIKNYFQFNFFFKKIYKMLCEKVRVGKFICMQPCPS